MKYIFLPMVGFLVLIGCSSSARSTKPQEIEPRRIFTPVDTAGLSIKDSFTVGEFVSDGAEYSKASRDYSTANFLADLGILERVDYETFDHLSELLFTNLPREGETKEVVLPNVLKAAREHSTNDVYLFITKKKSDNNRIYYWVETNIPINSVFSKIYDGYKIFTHNGFIEGQVPGNWVAVFPFAFADDLIIYQGFLYPSLASPLRYSGTGIGPDSKLQNLLMGILTIPEIKTSLEKAAQVVIAGMPENSDTIKYLEKCVALSLSAYSFLDNDYSEAARSFKMAREIDVTLPEDKSGENYKNLERIMQYIIRPEVLEIAQSATDGVEVNLTPDS